MVGLRSGDLHIVASPSPPPSFHHHHHQDGASLIHSHQQDHHHHHHHHSSISINNSSNSSSSTALGVCGSVIPTGHVGEDHSHNINRNQTSSRSEIQLWQNQQSLLQNPNILFNAAAGGVNIIKSRRSTTSVISTTASTITCHDCGNQAKKDCSHRRCRTCCKSRGFDCATHVKSTWVPAARRRERHQLLAASSSVAVAGGSSSSTTSAGVKKPRLISSQATNSHTSTSSSARSFGTSSSHHQDASFREALPRQVLAPAVFKCVRVSAIDDGGDQDEYAYQAVVKIGGHVFKGFLYDQGVIDDERSSDGLFTDMSDLHLGGINSNNSTRSGDGISKQGILMTSSSSPIIDPSITTTTVYVKSGSGGLLGVGTDYNNQHF